MSAASDSSSDDDFSQVCGGHSGKRACSPPRGRSVRRRLSFSTPRAGPSRPASVPPPPRKRNPPKSSAPAKREPTVRRRPATAGKSTRKPRGVSIFPGNCKSGADKYAIDKSQPKDFVVSKKCERIVLTAQQLAEIEASMSLQSGVRDPADPTKMLSRKDAVIFDEGCAISDPKHLVQSILQPTLTMLHAPAQSMKSATPLVPLAVARACKKPTVLIVSLKQSGVEDMRRKLVRCKGDREQERQVMQDIEDLQDAEEVAALEDARVMLEAVRAPSDPIIIYVDGAKATWVNLMKESGFVDKVVRFQGGP